MSTGPTLFERALGESPDDETPDDTETLLDRPGITATRTHIGGEEVPLEAPETPFTFEDDNGLLSGEFGQPRPREFWHAKQLGQTPPMHIIKHGIISQLTGGKVKVVSEDELQGPMADLASLIEDIYAGPHFQGRMLDDLITGAVNNLVDLAWSYWETLPSADGSFPVAGFKPLPPLNIQHNTEEDSGELADDPAYYYVPMSRHGQNITVGADPVPLDEEQIVPMRGPLTAEDDALYGQSLATKVREWLELIIDVDVHQKRHYADSQLPAGFLHFTGALNPDDLNEIEQDISEVSGDPHELVTTSTEGDATWIPVGEGVVDLDAIAEQKWYFKLVFAAAGLNANEIGLMIGEDSGFAKETPAQAKQVFKKITRPYKRAIFGPQNQYALPRILDGFDTEITDPLQIDLERFDPLHEQIERQEMVESWAQGHLSLAESRGQLGRETDELLVELGGVEVDLANTPKYVVDKLIQAEQPALGENMGGNGEASIGDDPVLTLPEAGEKLGVEEPHLAAARLAQEQKQLDDRISIQSSFLVSVAYDRIAPLLQLEFERENAPTNAIYWYGSYPERKFYSFLQASSKGKYFNRNIRGEYRYARVQ